MQVVNENRLLYLALTTGQVDLGLVAETKGKFDKMDSKTFF